MKVCKLHALVHNNNYNHDSETNLDRKRQTKWIKVFQSQPTYATFVKPESSVVMIK